jgi:hypothetical protein
MPDISNAEGVKTIGRYSAWRCATDRYEITDAAWAGDAKSMPEGAYEIWARGVVGHSAENLRNTGSAPRAR